MIENYTRQWRNFICLGLLVTALPFLLCLLFNLTFAPMDSLYSTVLPFAGAIPGKVPFSHFWSDTVCFFWPRLAAVARHEFPISFVAGGGLPLFADSISGFYDPLVWLTFGLFGSSATVLTCFWGIQYVVLFLGLFCWLSRAGAKPLGALTGSLLLVFTSTYFPGSYMSFQTLGVFCFLPWALWAEEKYGASRAGNWLPQFFLVLCILGGNLQTAAYPLIAYGIWALIHRKFRYIAYSLGLVLLFTLPFWFESIQYHILENIQTLSGRHSEVPLTWLGRLKALLALPAVVVPDLFGSSTSIDFLKGFQTSLNYFIGSVGSLGFFVVVSTLKPANLKNKNFLFASVLLLFSIFVFITPLLNFFYYRFLCLICFALAVMVSLKLSEVSEIRFKKICWTSFILVGSFALAAAFVKHAYRQPLERFFIQKLSDNSTYSWWHELQEERVSRFFSNYLSNPPFLLGLFSWLAAPWILKKNKTLFAMLVVISGALVWWSNVSFQKVQTTESPAFIEINRELQRSGNYPLSRFDAARCGVGPFLFGFVTNEYSGTPRAGYYGSTNVADIGYTGFVCDQASKLISLTDSQITSLSNINVLAIRSGWKIQDKSFEFMSEHDGFSLWRRKFSDEKPAVVFSTESGKEKKSFATQVVGWDHSGLKVKIDSSADVPRWGLSLPYYPGWKFKLDGETLTKLALFHSMPIFETPLGRGQHLLEADFTPWPLYIGLLGTLAAILLALWTSTLKRD
jgi:hypothetical protein